MQIQKNSNDSTATSNKGASVVWLLTTSLRSQTHLLWTLVVPLLAVCGWGSCLTSLSLFP